MTYSGIEKRRFAQLLDWGTDDHELRRFFSDTRLQLIQMGAKVQNPPHGKPARVRMLAQGLPSPTDRVVQKWFSEHMKMLDPKTVDDVLGELRLYEEAGENPPEDEAKRLARSCLVHLFSNEPPAKLMSFLRPAQVAVAAPEPPEAKEATGAVASGNGSDAFTEALGRTLLAMAEGRDPDEFLSALPPAMAAFVAGVQAVRSGRNDDAQIAMEALDHQPQARALLVEYVARKASVRSGRATGGLEIFSFVRPDETFTFDFDRDEVLAVCTRDYPEKSVFLHPLAMRACDGTWLDLSNDAYRKNLFHTSGDLIAFPGGGRDTPRQPKRWEIGIWHVAENKGSNTGHRTNFHIASEKIPVYEVRDVPFESSNHDSVRAYIKHVFEERGTSPMPLLFLLRDQVIVGCPVGKDLTRDEGFDGGLPRWHTLSAFRFEGRMLVPGPLPPSEPYECEALASTLRKLFAGNYWDSDKPTRALTKRLQNLIESGLPKLSSERATRLRVELDSIDAHDGAMPALLEEVMRNPLIGAQVDRLVQEKVDALVAQKEQLRKSVQQLEQKQADLTEQRRLAEKEQRAIAPAVAKAIRSAFDKARTDALGTLGEVTIFKTLMDELFERPAPAQLVGPASPVSSSRESHSGTCNVRSSVAGVRSITDTLRALGVTPKAARALEAVGLMARECGLMLIVDGLAARVAAEAWLSDGERLGTVVECGFGETDDRAVRTAMGHAPASLAILDANMSPFDVYARPLVDAVLCRLAGIHNQSFQTRVVMSMTDGMAALPLPGVAESLSLRVYLDRIPVFLQQREAEAWLEDIEDAEQPAVWFSRLWKPAKAKVLNYLRALPVDEVAIILAALEVASSGNAPSL